MNAIPSDETMIVTLRVHEFCELIRRVVADAMAVKATRDLLDLKQVAERYGIGRDALLAAARRGDIELSRGPRRKIWVRGYEIEQWITDHKFVPTSRKAEPTNLEEWDRQVEEEFQRMAATASPAPPRQTPTRRRRR